jgi:4'-phosphopantetheinyl transferase EntD
VTAAERAQLGHDPCGGRLLFAIKEAVYKTVHPLDGLFLDHHDVEVSLVAGTATVRNGRTVSFRYCVDNRIVALAFIPMPSAPTSLSMGRTFIL